jgi:class 3 adenylate cyclase
MSAQMRDAVGGLAHEWKLRGQDIGFGIGIAQGFATIGQIGFEGRLEYSTIGTVINLAARLCAEATNGQIVVSQRIANSVDGVAVTKPIGELKLKGLSRVVPAFNIEALRSG